jgi:hypothetical protein
MNKFILTILTICVTVSVLPAQSKTTETLHKEHGEALSLFLYHNTLRMLNQDEELDALIKDIEKMKFLMIDKSAKAVDYKKLVGNYKTEAFEEVMTSRHEGKNFDVFVKEKDGKTKSMLVLINDSTSLYVLDIVGSVALNKVTSLFSKIDESADIGKKIKAFSAKQEDKD